MAALFQLKCDLENDGAEFDEGASEEALRKLLKEHRCAYNLKGNVATSTKAEMHNGGDDIEGVLATFMCSDFLS